MSLVGYGMGVQRVRCPMVGSKKALGSRPSPRPRRVGLGGWPGGCSILPPQPFPALAAHSWHLRTGPWAPAQLQLSRRVPCAQGPLQWSSAPPSAAVMVAPSRGTAFLPSMLLGSTLRIRLNDQGPACLSPGGHRLARYLGSGGCRCRRPGRSC